jgi:hypothetical protein
MDAFNSAWLKLATEEPLRCSATDVEYAAAAKPSLVIITVRIKSCLSTGHLMFSILMASQVILHKCMLAIRASSHVAPVLAWQNHAANFIVRAMLPADQGGSLADLLRPFTDEERAGGRSLPVTGDVISFEGNPEMHDWELQPTYHPMSIKSPKAMQFLCR